MILLDDLEKKSSSMFYYKKGQSDLEIIAFIDPVELIILK